MPSEGFRRHFLFRLHFHIPLMQNPDLVGQNAFYLMGPVSARTEISGLPLQTDGSNRVSKPNLAALPPPPEKMPSEAFRRHCCRKKPPRRRCAPHTSGHLQ
ncbi:hypothetical protein [Neisseria polysaccharea]|uniref:hypothetical protein n=1 Tax=Neisseria polysaccharea TaxID=489 RepID=UPI0002D3E2EA|nr:hypothetical protein [Neisseria polysaccharea]